MTTETIATVSAPPTLARIARVILRGWNGLDRTYDLEGASAVIRGANGAGKTALVDALRFAVAGTSRRGKRPEDVWRHARSEATEIAVTVDLAGLSWTRGIRREEDKLVGYLEIAGKRRLKIREAEALLAAELCALPAQFSLAAGYHDLSPQAKRTFLLGLLGGADEAVDLAALVREAAASRLTAQEPGQAFPLDPLVAELARVISGRDASADLLALGEKARELVGARAAAHRETLAASRALQDQALTVAVIAGTAAQADADLVVAREARVAAASALATAQERENSYRRAFDAEADARQAVTTLEEAATERSLFDDQSETDRLRAAMAVAQAALDQSRQAEEAAREIVRERDAQADAACLDLRAKEARASLSRFEAEAKRVAYRVAARAAVETSANADALAKKIEALEHGPAAEALACWNSLLPAIVLFVADSQRPTRTRLDDLLRDWASADYLQQVRDHMPTLMAAAALAEERADSADGEADIWSDTAADAEIEHQASRANVDRAVAARTQAAEDVRRLARETVAAEAIVAAAKANMDAAVADDPGRELAIAYARLAEALTALDACPMPARPLAEIAAEAGGAVVIEKAAEERARSHREAGARARNLAETLERAHLADLEHTASVAVQRAVQDVRELWMVAVVAPLTEAMRLVVLDAWPAQPGCHAVGVYAELETIHGSPAADLGVVVLGDDDSRYRVSYETMSGAQAVVFDAALLAALIARGSRLAALPLELDAMTPSTAAMLLEALAEHAPQVQVLAATWQVLPRPAGWNEVEA